MFKNRIVFENRDVINTTAKTPLYYFKNLQLTLVPVNCTVTHERRKPYLRLKIRQQTANRFKPNCLEEIPHLLFVCGKCLCAFEAGENPKVVILLCSTNRAWVKLF